MVVGLGLKRRTRSCFPRSVVFSSQPRAVCDHAGPRAFSGLMLLIVGMMLLEHVVACGWFGIGSLTSESDTWLTKSGAEGEAFTAPLTRVIGPWARCNHWTMFRTCGCVCLCVYTLDS